MFKKPLHNIHIIIKSLNSVIEGAAREIIIIYYNFCMLKIQHNLRKIYTS